MVQILVIDKSNAADFILSANYLTSITGTIILYISSDAAYKELLQQD